MIPLREKLSFLWDKARHRDAFYTPVYHDNVPAGYHDQLNWLKADRLPGQDEQYSITFTSLTITPNRKPVLRHLPLGNECGAAFSREDVEEIFREQEQQWKQYRLIPAAEQPFKDRQLPTWSPADISLARQMGIGLG